MSPQYEDCAPGDDLYTVPKKLPISNFTKRSHVVVHDEEGRDMTSRGAIRAAIWRASYRMDNVTAPREVLAKWLYAIAVVESGGEWARCGAEAITFLEGKMGEIGPWQGTYGAFLDCQRVYGRHSQSLRRDEMSMYPDPCTLYGQAIERIIYIHEYGDPYPDDDGFDPEMQAWMWMVDMAKVHHGGPDRESSDMDDYVRKFEKALDEESMKVFGW